MTQIEQVEPCVALHLSSEGVELTISAQLRQGAKNWTPEEAGEWFSKNWYEAQQALLVCTVCRFMVQEPSGRLVRSGETTWAVVPSPQEERLPPAPVSRRVKEAPPAAPQVAPVPSSPEPLPELTRVPDSTGMTESEDAQQRVFLVLSQKSEPVTIPDLRRATEMSDYRVRRALKALGETGQLEEVTQPAKAGRWKEQTVYSLKGQ